MRSFTLSAFLLVSACGAKGSIENSQTQSVILDRLGSRWVDARAIPVCIMNGSDVSAQLLADIKSVVTEEYTNKAGIGFTG